MKGITLETNAYRVRVMVNYKTISKRVYFKNHSTKEEAYVEAKRICSELQQEASEAGLGNSTSKYSNKTPVSLTQDILKEYVHYDPQTGNFTLKKAIANCHVVGTVLGTSDDKGYKVISLFRKMYKLHRLAFLYMEGKLPELHIDHVDGNPSNNTWANLRQATNAQNQHNKRAIPSASGYKNIAYIHSTKKFRVTITKNCKATIRFYSSLEEAIEGARQLRVEIHGEFANHG